MHKKTHRTVCLPTRHLIATFSIHSLLRDSNFFHLLTTPQALTFTLFTSASAEPVRDTANEQAAEPTLLLLDMGIKVKQGQLGLEKPQPRG